MKKDNQIARELKKLDNDQLLKRLTNVESELQALKEEVRTKIGSLAIITANIYEKVNKEPVVEAT